MGVKKEALKVAENLAQNDTVINKTIELGGLLFPYLYAKREAVNLYIDEIKKSDLPLETKTFLILNIKKYFKGLKNQKSIAKVAYDNAKTGTDFAEKSGVNEEWFDRFMDSAKFVSSGDMQFIWGKILANEFETPGSTPPNMIRILSEITPELARAFSSICNMNVEISLLNQEEHETEIGQELFVPYSGNDKQFDELGIGFNLLNELETLGIIKFDPLCNYADKRIKTKKLLIRFEDKKYKIEKYRDNYFPLGNVMLTKAGETLRSITEKSNFEEYSMLIENYMTSNNVSFSKL